MRHSKPLIAELRSRQWRLAERLQHRPEAATGQLDRQAVEVQLELRHPESRAGLVAVEPAAAALDRVTLMPQPPLVGPGSVLQTVRSIDRSSADHVGASETSVLWRFDATEPIDAAGTLLWPLFDRQCAPEPLQVAVGGQHLGLLTGFGERACLSSARRAMRLKPTEQLNSLAPFPWSAIDASSLVPKAVRPYSASTGVACDCSCPDSVRFGFDSLRVVRLLKLIAVAV